MESLKLVSQNGQWGIELHVLTDDPNADPGSPIEGDLERVGKFGGMETYRLTPRKGAGTWHWLTNADVEALDGASVVEQSLQGGKSASLVSASALAILKTWGYKRRSSSTEVFQSGDFTEATEGQLYAAGILTPQEEPKKVEPPQPTAMGRALLAALGN